MLIYFASRIMLKKDRDFLVRAQAVTEKYEARLDELTAKVELSQKSLLRADRMSFSKFMDFMDLSDRLDRLFSEYIAHTDRMEQLTDKLREERALNAMCADANRLAGTDGANFWTKAGKVIEEQAE